MDHLEAIDKEVLEGIRTKYKRDEIEARKALRNRKNGKPRGNIQEEKTEVFEACDMDDPDQW